MSSHTPRVIAMDETSGRITFGPVRVDFQDVFVPRKKTFPDGGTSEKYELSFIWPKAGGEELKAAILKLAGNAVVGTWPDAATRPRKLTTPVRDADDGDWTNDGVPKSEKYDYYAGHFMANASTQFKPGVVDQQVQPILSASELPRGSWVNIQCHLYAYDNNKKGVSLGLDNVQLVDNSDPLSGGGEGPKAADAFKPVGGSANPLGEAEAPFDAPADDLFG